MQKIYTFKKSILLQNILQIKVLQKYIDRLTKMSLVDKENKDTVNFMLILSIAGLLVKIFFSNNKPADASVWGYGVTAVAVLIMMIITFANHTSLAALNQIKNPLSIFSLSIPSFFTLLMLIWLISINTVFADVINSGNYSHEYKYFSLFESIMMIIQIGVIFLISSSVNEADISKYKTAIYITSIFNICFIGMMNIILYFFTTDG